MSVLPGWLVGLAGWLPPPLTYSRNRDARFLGSAIDATELLLPVGWDKQQQQYRILWTDSE